VKTPNLNTLRAATRSCAYLLSCLESALSLGFASMTCSCYVSSGSLNSFSSKTKNLPPHPQWCRPSRCVPRIIYATPIKTSTSTLNGTQTDTRPGLKESVWWREAVLSWEQGCSQREWAVFILWVCLFGTGSKIRALWMYSTTPATTQPQCPF
jgi:hypothetical protein